VHQYQMDAMVRPTNTPGHGSRLSSAERMKCSELYGGTPQLEYESSSERCISVVLGTALMNSRITDSKPPASMKPKPFTSMRYILQVHDRRFNLELNSFSYHYFFLLFFLISDSLLIFYTLPYDCTLCFSFLLFHFYLKHFSSSF